MFQNLIISDELSICKFFKQLNFHLYLTKPQIQHLENMMNAMISKGFKGKVSDIAELAPARHRTSITRFLSISSWNETSEHKITLSDKELRAINDTSDIQVGVKGSDVVYTIDIKKGIDVSTSSLTTNDLSNTLEGKIDNLQFSVDYGENWCDYTQDITFSGKQEVLVRYKANGTNLQGKSYKFVFKEDTNTPTRTYIRSKHLSLVDFSSENGTSSNYAAKGMIDETPFTTWHTKFNTFDSDKFLTIKLDEAKYISGIDYQPASVNGRFKSVEVYTSPDGNSWNMSASVKGLPNNEYQKHIDFKESVLANYIKIVATETYGNYSSEYNKYASGKGVYFFEDTTKKQSIMD